MCEWGTDREITLGRRRVMVDACIAATVLAVNAKGIRTTGSCCGHSEDDHDGYGGLCDGLGFNGSRMICDCRGYLAADSRDVALSAAENLRRAIRALTDCTHPVTGASLAAIYGVDVELLAASVPEDHK